MRKIYIPVILCLLFIAGKIQYAVAQCTFAPNGIFPSTAQSLPGPGNCARVTIGTVAHTGEFTTFSPVTVGSTYQFSTSVSTDYLTIADSATHEILAYGTQPLIYTPVSTHILNVFRNKNSICWLDADQRIFWVQNMTAATPTNVTEQVPMPNDVIIAGWTNVQHLRLKITPCSSGNVTSFTFSTNGSTNPAADILRAKVYYTANTFWNTLSQFGNTVENPNGTFTVTGDKSMTAGVAGYFWLFYDLNCTAKAGDVLDAEVNSFTFSNVAYTPTTTTTSGNRIIAPLYKPFGGSNYSTPMGQGSSNNPVVSSKITTNNTIFCPVGSVEKVAATVLGTFAQGEITAARCYYTSAGTFSLASATQFGTTINNPSSMDALIFTGPPVNVNSFFWVTYDFSCSIAGTHTVGATIDSVSIGGVYFVSNSNPPSLITIRDLYAPSCTDGNNATNIPAGSVNNTMVYANINGPVNCPSIITKVTGAASGTFATGDVLTAKCYYTSSSAFSFASATQFGSTISSPGNADALVFTGSKALATGTGNYFWIVYDVSCNADANTVNANINSLEVNGIPYNISTGTINSNTILPAPSASVVQASAAGTVSGAANEEILYISLGASPCLTNITQLNFNNTSTNIADIAKARLYYTTTPTFTTVTQFGSDVINPGAAFSVIGTLSAPVSGTMYFWVVYDIACAAPFAAGNTADASFAGMITNNGLLTAANPDPAGARMITPVTTGDYIQFAPTAVLGSAGGNPFDITGKTMQSGEPGPLTNIQPSANNGSVLSNYSWGTVAGSTQWYKLIVPATGYGSSGNLLIRAITSASPDDAQLALWKFPNLVTGSGCGTTPNFTGAILLAANDDAIVSGTGYTGSSTLNSVIRVRLTPGSTYYIQLDGYNTSAPSGDLIVEDLADAAGKNVSNNGFGDIHNPAASEMLYASYEVIGDDGWTYYYNNNGTSTNIADDKVILGLNWSSSSAYLWNGSNGTITNDMMNHVRRDATSSTAPSTTAPGAATGTDAFAVWSGRLAAFATSGDLKPTAPYVQAGASHWWMMNKFWNVFPNVQPTTPVGVRFFYSDADYTALNSAIAAGGGTVLTSHADMEFLKFTKSATTHYTNAEVDPASGHSALLKPTVSKIAWANTDAVQAGINQTQFSVNTFSGGGGGSTGQAALALPISLEYFTGRKQAAVNVLDWKVNSSSASVLALERSTDRVNYKTSNVQAASIDRMLTPFTYTDAAPAAGVNYYRLKITNADGESKYSNVVALINKDKGFELISMAPNPVQHSTVLSLSSVKAGKIELSVSDVTGKVVMKQSVSVIAGNNPITLNFATLAAGTYQITAINADGDSKSTRFVKF